MPLVIRPLLVLCALFTISLITLWPGIMSPDASSQYAAAVAGIYSDHHPPLMSWVWRQVNTIYSGTGIIYSMHLLLLYTAMGIFIYIFRESKFKWWYVVYPLIPGIFAYTIFIVKDASFVFSYLLSGSIISLIITNRRQPGKLLLLSIATVLLLYGTAVKYQAQYLLIFFTLALAFCVDFRFDYKTLVRGVVIYLLIMCTIFVINMKLVPYSQKSHSWQLVKLYDLSAISIAKHKPLYPEFVLADPNFDFTKVQQLFNPQKVDDLVFPEDNVLRAGMNAPERDALLEYWRTTVLHNPWLYLKVRLRLWLHNLTSIPSEYNDPASFLRSTTLAPLISIPWITDFINSSYNFCMNFFMFLWIFPLQLLYCWLGLRNYKQSRYAAPLTLFSFSSLTMLAVLLFFSMAGVARYVLFCTCFIHASHGFAYFCWRKRPPPIS